MLRYAALAVILSFISPGIFCTAAGNIGCLFSETLCNQEKEWCYDDYAFGRCLPLYGNVREEDMHRYELGTEELHVLEREMQRLFLLGYRWSHTYTQCVLQALLKAIRNKDEFDVSGCNAELDQDLEGALKAIEGEEMEHIDPKNLAIVRFMPSVINPHSDYADEMYYPPVEEMLPPFRGKLTDDDDGEEAGDTKGTQGPIENSEDNEQSKNKSSPSSLNVKDVLSNSKVNMKDQPKQLLVQPQALKHTSEEPLALKHTSEDEKENNRIESHFNLPPPAIPMALLMDPQSDDPSVNFEGDYDYDLGYELPYRLSTNPVYKRGGYMGGVGGPRENGDEVDLESYFRNSLRPRDIRELARMLSMIKPSEKSLPSNPPPLYNKIASLESGYKYEMPRYGVPREQGYFREIPVAPSYRERLFPSRNEGKIEIVSPFESYPSNRRIGPAGPQIPVLNPPPEEEVESPPDTIHSGFVKGFENAPLDTSGLVKEPDSYQRDEYNKNNYNNRDKFYNNNDNSVTRFEKDPSTSFKYDSYKPSSSGSSPDASDRYRWMNDVRQENDKNSYRGGSQDAPTKYDQPYGPQMNGMSQQQPLPKDAYYGGRPPYPPYGYNGFEYSDYPAEYYDYAGDYLELGDPTPWNFQRDERLDVKKPGPFFKSANNYAFDYGGDGGDIDGSEYPQLSPEWMSKLNPLQGEALLLPKLQQGKQDAQGIDGKQNPDQIPDLLLSEEGYVEALSDNQRQKGDKTGTPKADSQIVSKEDKHLTTQPDSYVYISISGRFHSEREAEQLVQLILHLVGLDMKHIQNLSVENNQVMFQVQQNSLGMTAAHLAERTEELRASIKDKTGMEITQAGVGTKSAMSAVVYSSGERKMLAVAAIVCGICAALLVAATVLFFMRRHARSKAKMQGLTAHDSEASKDYQDLCRARMAGKGEGKETVTVQGHTAGHTPSGHAPGQRISSLSKESDNGNNSPSSRSSTSSWSEEPVVSNMDISTGHMVLSYMEDHLRNKDRLEQEWVALCAYEAEPCACNIALKPENAQKNRYSDVTPYDHNRVILNEHTNVSGSNYINASSITDHDPRNPAYISTQGPLASTAADFWQLVWEQGSVVIVMLTRLTENGQALCHRYWPEEGSELYHIYEVHLVSEHIWCDDYLVRSFYLKNVRTSETRTVTQFHFLSWPESGIPASTKALLEFRRKVNKSYRGRSCPIIVHCSDGVGRSGTYCLIDMVLNRMAKGAKEIDIAATLEHIRDQRPNMVKTKIQFEFVLMAVAEEVHAILKALPQ